MSRIQRALLSVSDKSGLVDLARALAERVPLRLSVKTKAERRGDKYVVNGSKIWTTHAHLADHIFCLVRTDNSGKPQAGISFLLIDMDTPGIVVEPIITMAGDHGVAAQGVSRFPQGEVRPRDTDNSST